MSTIVPLPLPRFDDIFNPPLRKPEMPEENQCLLPMMLQVPWTPAMELGMGYDYMRQALLPKVVSVDNHNVYRSGVSQSCLEYKYVTSQEQFNQLVEASAEGSGSVEGIQVKASLAFTQSVKFSETSETLVLSWYSDSTHFDRIKNPALDANALAESKSDPGDFRLKRGDYFISGGLQRAEFHAVYNMSAQKKEDLQSFKTAVAASAPDVFSASGSVAFTQAAAASHVAITATVHQSASKSSIGMGKTAGLTPDKVIEMFTKFQTDHKDSWAVAELTHFSELTPSLSPLAPAPRSFQIDRALLLCAQTSYHGLLGMGLLTRDAHESLMNRATALDTKVKTEGPLYWTHPATLADDRKEAEELAKDVRVAVEFLHRVKILAGGDGGCSNVVGRIGGEAGIGTHGDQTSIPDGVKVMVDTFDLTGSWESGRITRSADKLYTGCTIIYLKANNNWGGDDTGGALTDFSGGVGCNKVRFGCIADFDRGLSWSFTIKYVEIENGGPAA
jgi:hypothetical protein